MLSERQAQILAAVLEELRPGDWTRNQVLGVLYENREQPHSFDTLLQVAVNAALNPQIKSPTGIYLPGKHWELPAQVKNAPKPIPCQQHTGQDAHSCSPCWSEIKLDQRPENMLGKRMAWVNDMPPGDPPMTIAEAKKQIQEMKATLGESGFSDAKVKT